MSAGVRDVDEILKFVKRHTGWAGEATGDRGDIIGQVNLAHAAIEQIGHVNIAGAISRQARRRVELGGGAGSILESGRAPGQGRDCAVEGHEADKVVARIGHDQAAAGKDNALRTAEMGEGARAIVTAWLTKDAGKVG